MVPKKKPWGDIIILRTSVIIVPDAPWLYMSGAAQWYNPAWLLINALYRIFLRVSQGASRLQEVLADRWAAIICGPQAFSEGLTHVIRQSIEFRLLSNIEIELARKEERRLTRHVDELVQH